MKILNCWILFFLMIGSSTYAQNSCYNPLRERHMISIYGERFLENIAPLLREAHQDFGFDPRMVFHRMVGEARGNPNITNRSSGAYGIFQFLGNYYRQRPHRQQIESLYRTLNSPYNKNSINHRRYVQVHYYLKVAIPFVKKTRINSTYGSCPTWRRMSHYDKVVSMGWGSCSSRYKNMEKSILNRSHAAGSYRPEILLSIPGLSSDAGLGSNANTKALCHHW